jgi:hypothetical protein
MDQTGDITPSPPLLALGDADAALCADGFCAVLRTAYAAEEAGASR